MQGAIVDLDGTVYLGERVVPGAPETIEWLRERGIEVLFCSNNPTKTPPEYVQRLAGMGIDADESEILPASTVTREYLRENHADASVYLLGTDSLGAYLEDGGVTLVGDSHEADVYVTSWTSAFEYTDMAHALEALDEETTFLGTDPDRTIPTEDGEIPGSGAVIGAIARTVGREPDVVLGKPARETGELALERLGVDPGECVVIGDRLNTDLALGEAFGMTTVLVRTGVSDDADIADSGVTPDHVLDSLADLPDVLDL